MRSSSELVDWLFRSFFFSEWKSRWEESRAVRVVWSSPPVPIWACACPTGLFCSAFNLLDIFLRLRFGHLSSSSELQLPLPSTGDPWHISTHHRWMTFWMTLKSSTRAKMRMREQFRRDWNNKEVYYIFSAVAVTRLVLSVNSLFRPRAVRMLAMRVDVFTLARM